MATPPAEKSQLQFFSMGIVAKDKAPNSPWIEVIPIEHSFMTPTHVQAAETSQEYAHSSDGAQDTVKETRGNTIPARWRKVNSYMVTPPDVVKTDEVTIYRLGETDIYFWEDNNSANVKREVNVIYAFPADPTNQMADDLSNAYVVQISSKEKMLQIRTSMSNGEKAAFNFQFNLRDGIYQCTDQKGNKQWINSVKNDVGMQNANASKFNIIKEEMFGYAKKRIRFETETLELVNKHFKHTSSDSQTIASASYKQTTTGAWNLTAGSFKVDSQSNEFVGVVKMPDAKIGTVTFSIHVHREQGDGNDVSTPH